MRTEVSNTKGRIEEPVVEPKPPLPRPRKLTEGTFVWGDKERHLEDNAGEFPDTQFSSVEPKGKETHGGIFLVAFITQTN